MSTYDRYKNKAYSLRLPNELRLKFEEIARIQGYTKTSKAYQDLIQKYVEAYEEQFGTIQVKAEE